MELVDRYFDALWDVCVSPDHVDYDPTADIPAAAGCSMHRVVCREADDTYTLLELGSVRPLAALRALAVASAPQVAAAEHREQCTRVLDVLKGVGQQWA